MAQVVSGAGYNGPNMIANLPTVPQKSFTPHGGFNQLENLLAIVVPPNQSFPGSKHNTTG